MSLLHQRENNQETEDFLKANGKKFSADCIIAMKLMYQGVVMTSQDCWNKYGIHDRRLRECRAARPDIVKSKWAMKINEKGKLVRSHVEYWIEKPKVYPTKSELQQWWDEYQNEQPNEEPSFSKPTTNPYPLKTWQQQELF